MPIEMTGNEGIYMGDDMQRSTARREPRTLWFIVGALTPKLPRGHSISYFIVYSGLLWSL